MRSIFFSPKLPHNSLTAKNKSENVTTIYRCVIIGKHKTRNINTPSRNCENQFKVRFCLECDIGQTHQSQNITLSFNPISSYFWPSHLESFQKQVCFPCFLFFPKRCCHFWPQRSKKGLGHSPSEIALMYRQMKGGRWWQLTAQASLLSIEFLHVAFSIIFTTWSGKGQKLVKWCRYVIPAANPAPHCK